MKPLAFLLAVSIAANAALAFLLVRNNNAASATGGSFAGERVQVVDGSDTAAADGKATAPGGGKAGAAGLLFAGLDPKKIGSLTTAELKALVEKLRAAGFPASFIRAIAAAEIRERHSSELKALLDNQPEEPFWERKRSPDPKLMSALRALNRQQADELRDLLGAEAVAADESAYWRRRQYGDLSSDKLLQVQDIVRDYSDLRSDVQASANGILLPEDREKYDLLEKEQRADLAAILTPEELENFELRSSSAAAFMRSQLSTFKPNEQEFRALYSALRAAESQYGSLLLSAGSTEQMAKIRDAALAGLQSQLSPERLAELKQATDPRYQMTNRLVARLGLPAQTSVDLVNLQQLVQQKVNTIRRDSTLDAATRNAQINVVAQTAERKLTEMLTPRGYEAYKQYGGQWLKAINPPQRPQSATP